MAKIFISYRRRDSGFATDSIAEKLRERFGDDSVFYDIDNIPLSVDFREHIGTAVGKCDVLLVVIGEKWVTLTDKEGKRRIDLPKDFVRIEIESALNRKIPIIPILLDETVMPAENDLPESIREIVYRNAAQVRPGSDSRQHIERLIRGLEKLIKTVEKPKPKKPNRKKAETVQNPESQIETPVEKSLEKRPDKRSLSDGKIGNEQNERARVLRIIKNGLGNFTDGRMLVGGEIKKSFYRWVRRAIEAYAHNAAENDILLIHDDTLIHSGTNGLLLTTDALYSRILHGEPIHLPYKEIQSVRIVTIPDPDNKFQFNDLVLVNNKALALSQGDQLDKKKVLIAEIIRQLAGL